MALLTAQASAVTVSLSLSSVHELQTIRVGVMEFDYRLLQTRLGLPYAVALPWNDTMEVRCIASLTRCLVQKHRQFFVHPATPLITIPAEQAEVATLAELRSGSVQALILPKPAAEYMSATACDLYVVGDVLLPTHQGFAFPPDTSVVRVDMPCTARACHTTCHTLRPLPHWQALGSTVRRQLGKAVFDSNLRQAAVFMQCVMPIEVCNAPHCSTQLLRQLQNYVHVFDMGLAVLEETGVSEFLRSSMITQPPGSCPKAFAAGEALSGIRLTARDVAGNHCMSHTTNRLCRIFAACRSLSCKQGGEETALGPFVTHPAGLWVFLGAAVLIGFTINTVPWAWERVCERLSSAPNSGTAPAPSDSTVGNPSGISKSKSSFAVARNMSLICSNPDLAWLKVADASTPEEALEASWSAWVPVVTEMLLSHSQHDIIK